MIRFTKLLLILVIFCYNSYTLTIPSKKFNLTIIHINDFHARFEEINSKGTECKESEKCIGGYARLVHMVKELKEKYKNDHPLYLNAADNFQGTPWYTMFRWNVTKHFLNLLPADVITLGNHEFDHGIDGLVPFIRSINSKIVVGNIDKEGMNFLQAQSSKDKIRGRTIIEKDGIKVGIIGVIIKTVNDLSSTGGNLTFLDEIMTVKRHSRLLAKENVNIIIVLSHCGIEIDKEIALKAGPLIDVIVGGHSHTYFYNGTDPNNPPDTPKDTYPVVIQQENGHKVLIVQAGAHAKYVGVIKLEFDSNGEVQSWDGNPIFLGNHVQKDSTIEKELRPWKVAVDAIGNEIIGETNVLIDISQCKMMECNAANFVADVMTKSFQNITGHENVRLALMNAGGVRASIEPGSIKYNHIITMLPFGSYLDLIKVPGKTLREAFEHAVDLPNNGPNTIFRNLMHVSGFRVEYDMKKPVKNRVQKILVLENNRKSYTELKDEEYYEVVVTSFIYKGGDGYGMFKRDQIEHVVGPIDIDAVLSYIRQKKVISPKLEKRIVLKY